MKKYKLDFYMARLQMAHILFHSAWLRFFDADN